MAGSLIRNTPCLMRLAWAAIAMALVLGALLAIRSCGHEPGMASLTWAGGSRLSALSAVPSSQTFIDCSTQERAVCYALVTSCFLANKQSMPQANWVREVMQLKESS